MGLSLNGELYKFPSRMDCILLGDACDGSGDEPGDAFDDRVRTTLGGAWVDPYVGYLTDEEISEHLSGDDFDEIDDGADPLETMIAKEAAAEWEYHFDSYDDAAFESRVYVNEGAFTDEDDAIQIAHQGGSNKALTIEKYEKRSLRECSYGGLVRSANESNHRRKAMQRPRHITIRGARIEDDVNTFDFFGVRITEYIGMEAYPRFVR